MHTWFFLVVDFYRISCSCYHYHKPFFSRLLCFYLIYLAGKMDTNIFLIICCRLWCDVSCKFLRGKLIKFSIVVTFFSAFKITYPVLGSSGIGASEMIASHIILRKQICTIILRLQICTVSTCIGRVVQHQWWASPSPFQFLVLANLVLICFGRELNLNIYSNEKSSISDLPRGCCHLLPDLT